MSSRRVKLDADHLELLTLIAQGFTYAEIAAQMQVTYKVVTAAAARLFRVLDARDRAHAVAIGYETNLLKKARVRATFYDRSGLQPDPPLVQTQLPDLTEVSLEQLRDLPAAEIAPYVEILKERAKTERYNLGSSGPPGRAD